MKLASLLLYIIEKGTEIILEEGHFNGTGQSFYEHN